jgi:peptide/nickel transport system substrate-binding protein
MMGEVACMIQRKWHKVKFLSLSTVILMFLVSACGSSTAPSGGAPAPSAPSAPSAPAPSGPAKGGTVTIAWEVPRDTMDQHQSNHTISRAVARQILDTLVVVDRKDGRITPGLAEKWDVSADGLTYTFQLKKGVTFHDGTPFDAAAVKFNLDRVVSPDIKPGLALKLLGGKKYAGTEVKDEFTAVVTFNEPHAPFMNGLSDAALGINSPAAVAKAGEDYGRTSVVGSGPFKFVEFVDKSHVTLVRNDAYNWAPAILNHTGPAYLDKIIYKAVPEVDTRRAALEVGEAQLIRANEQLVAALRAISGSNVDLVPKTGTSRWYLMNTSRAPLDDLKVRQAISAAIDREAIIMSPAFAGIGEVAILPIAAANWARDPAPFKQYGQLYDFDKANKLLDEAGWVVNTQTGIREKNGVALQIEINHNQGDVAFATPAQGMLREVGIDAKLVQGDFNAWFSNAQTGKFHLTTMSDSGWDWGIMSNFFEINGTYNFGKFNHNQLDSLLKQASVTADPDKRRELVGQAMQIALQEATLIPVYDEMYIYADRGIADVIYDEVGMPYLVKAYMQK